MLRVFSGWRGFVSLFFLLNSCNDRDNLPGNTQSGFSEKEVDLGRKLFFFNGLSGDGKQNCASCHLPQKAFSSEKILKSNGFERNVPSLLNLEKSTRFFWDGRETNLESLVIKPILSKAEMHGNLVLAIAWMNKSRKWKKDFETVYGRDTIYTALVARALSSYVRSLTVKPSMPLADSDYKRGKALFQALCQSCHKGEAFTDFALRRSVIAAEGPDSGHFSISHRKQDVYFFKTPGMARIAQTAPYTHDGRFSTLESLLMAYSREPGMQDLKNEKSRKALLKYMKTL
jgi:cytochrome c peroxidase